jgi:hypothetical protein
MVFSAVAIFSLLPALLPNAAAPHHLLAGTLPATAGQQYLGVASMVPAKHASRAAVVRMASSPKQQQQQQRPSWRKRVKAAGAALASAALVATPRGPARAVELPAASGVSRTADRGAGSPTSAAFGVLRRKKTKTLDAPYVHSPPRPDTVDFDAIVSQKTASRFTERSFMFSDSLTGKSDLELELEQLDDAANSGKSSKALSTAATYVGAAGMVYGTVQGLRGVERWMKRQELLDIEEEREMTGQYVSVDASDVETAIDPTTGKNLTIVKRKEPTSGASNSTGAAGAAEGKTPWLLRVLGLGGVSTSEDAFWAQAEAAKSVPPTGADTADASGGDSPGGGTDGADGGGAGGVGGTDGGGGDGGGGVEDDSEDVDAVDDLLR